MKSKLLYISLSFFLVILALHLLGSFFYFYWQLWWFDNLVHFLGGAGVGFFILWIFYGSGFIWQELPSQKKIFLTALILTIVVGVCWEIFEYINGLTQSTEGYTLDTFHDLLSDTVGGALAGWLTARKKNV